VFTHESQYAAWSRFKLNEEKIMIKAILATVILTVAMASGASAAMKKMDHMGKMDKMSMSHKCGKGMMMMHGKCMADKMMKKK
jgi:hypothetical protein